MSPDMVINPETKLMAAQEFINGENMIVPAIPGSMCVDGRYGTEQTPGMMATTGADLGYALTLLGMDIGLSPKQCFQLAYEASIALHGNFYAHTGHHGKDLTNAHDNTHNAHAPALDCGHCFKPTLPENAGKYSTKPKDAENLLAFAAGQSQVLPNFVVVNLEIPDHAESGLIINKGKTKTIRHSNPKGTQYFVYDVVRDQEYMVKFIEKVNEIGKENGSLKDSIDLQTFMTLHDKQRDATVSLLNKGPVFEVNLDEPKPKVKIF